jgi:hypothetical protein
MPTPLDNLPLAQQPDEGSHADLGIGVPVGERPSEPPSRTLRSRHGQNLALGGAALISAVAALMAVWLWGRADTGGRDEDASVTVSYEPLAEPVGDASPAVLESPADAAATPSTEAERPRRPAPSSPEAGSAAPRATASRPVRVPRTARPAQGGSSPPAAGSTGLVIITEPPGARVTVNGVGWGSAPLTLGNLAPGTKRVRVSIAGYESEERVVGADISRTRVTLRIQLRPVPDGRLLQ